MTTATKKTVLIVEDEEDIALLLKDRLELAGHNAHVARSGMKGLAYARKHRPDLVILDLMLPDMDGYDVCEELRMHYDSWIMPVLMLTALDKAIDQVRGFARGADAYLTKPYDPEELLQTVSYLLGESHVA